ncbi:MAG: hypothetical protein K8H85_10265 [Cyclobacteriaceae bacterium]|nr:hypothetical protein [Cyclobacteriaceae bacterium]
MTTIQIILSLIGLIAWSLLMFYLGLKEGRAETEFENYLQEWKKNNPEL